MAGLAFGASSCQLWGAPRTASASLAAARIADQLVVPAGAARATALPGPWLDRAASTPGCTPFVDLVREWTVRGSTGPEVSTFLQQHPVPGMTILGTGSGGTVSRPLEFWSVREGTADQKELVAVAIADVSGSGVGIRMDVQVIPAGAECVSAGSGAPAAP